MKNKGQSYFDAQICTLPGIYHNIEVKAVLSLFKDESAMKTFCLLISKNHRDKQQ